MDDKTYWLIWEIGVTTGLRISDILSLKTKQILRQKFYIHEKKSGKRKHVYIRQRILFEFKKYMRDTKKNINQKAFIVSRKNVWRVFKNTAAKLKIEKNIGTHTMRHTFSSNFIKKHSYKSLQKKLNHEKLIDTISYTIENKNL